MPQKAAIRHGWDSKKYNRSPNYNLFKKILKKQAGRLWNDVYAELRSAIKDHELLKILDYMVEKNVEMIDGIPYDKVSRWGMGPFKLAKGQLYVNPETGILGLVP